MESLLGMLQSAPSAGTIHPLVGLGLAFVAIGQGFAALGTWPPFLLLLAGVVIGTAWSTYGPAKGDSAPAAPPATVTDSDADIIPLDDTALDDGSEID